MKNYQFITIAVLVAVIAAALVWKAKKKKPCNCDGAIADIETATGE